MLELKIDMPSLIFAWQDSSPDNVYYLDTESGDIKMVNHSLIELKDLTDEIECNRERYLYVPKLDHKQLKTDLQDYIETVSDAKLKSILSVALESPHILSSLNKILANTAGEISRLEEFRNARSLLRIKQWLEANSISAKY